MPPRKYGKRRGARKGARRARVSRPVRNLNTRYQVATLVETVDPAILLVENVPYYQQTFLRAFKRAIGMSNLYEQFRIEEVAYTYSPTFNVFQETNNGPTVPVFYHCMDRLQSLNPAAPTTLTDIVQMGAQRRKFDKPITVRYKPNTMVTTGAQTAGVTVLPANQQILQINGADYGRWFPCITQNVGSPGDNTPNTLSAHDQYYNGHWVYIEQASGSQANTPSCSISVTIRVSYKNPCVNETPLASDYVQPLPIKVGFLENRTYTTLQGLIP